MKLNQTGYQFLMTVEGLRLKPYLCDAGRPTIGHGNTYYPNGKKVTMQDPPITKEFAAEMLVLIADRFAREVTSLVKKPVTQNQFNALVSFAYNVGSDIDADTIPEGLGDSTLLKLVNVNPNDGMIAKEFLKWNKSGGKINNGLINRRIKESALYFTK